MRALTCFVLLTLAVAGWAAPPPKAVPLEVSGNTVTYVRSFPCQVTAKAGADFYIWGTPDGVKATSNDNILTITAAPNGPARISVVAVTVEIDFEKKTKKVTKDVGVVDVNFGAPIPVPPDPPKPIPPPVPVGVPAWVVVVEETQEAMKGRGAYYTDSALQAKLKTLGCKMRLADKDAVDKNGNSPADLKPYFDRAKSKKLPQLYIVAASGDVLHEGDLPGTPAALVEILTKLGGK